jgi:MarC family membrane protein
VTEPSLLSATILLVLVIDPVGNIPLAISALERVPDARRRALVVVRECAIAFVLLLAFLFFGERFLALMQLSGTSLEIAGGVILFLIALRMVFPRPEGLFGDTPDGEPFIVPLAIPAIAGPSAMATVLLLVSRQPQRLGDWILALLAAILVTALILLLAQRIRGWVGERGVLAMERLMGLVLTAIAIETMLRGVRSFVAGF